MDFTESTKIVFNRIQKTEPEHVHKILGYLMLHDHGERDMIRLAFTPDNVIQSLINKAKIELGLAKPSVSSPISHSQVNQVRGSEMPLQLPLYPTNLPRDFVPPGIEDYRLQSQMQFMPDFPNNYCYNEHALNVRTSRRSPSLPEFPLKVCHYFIKGFCKHGNNCRYFHPPMPESFSQFFNPNSNDFSNDDHVVSPGSLEKLEFEIIELLKSRRGELVSIASLPTMYYAQYGRNLQADGYLTESQRQGKAGYSLTKLLARLKNSIHVIDRPHGQHSVILAEDIPKYSEYGEKNEPGGIIPGSRQIYLTFPAESNFTELDVSNYFSKYGQVQDVRIPCNQKRMFGFVTFAYAETVKHILSKGNPHNVCGARVLVKPYREKARLVDRKYSEKMQHPICYSSHYIDADAELHSMPRVCEKARFLRKQQFIEENEQAIEFERRRLSEMHLAAAKSHNFYYGYSMDEFKHPEAHAEQQAEFPSAKEFNYLLDVWNNGSTSEGKIRHINTNYNDHDSQGINLPESPFASAIVNGISTVM